MLPEGTDPDDAAATTVQNVMGAWLQRAMLLLVRDDINLNAGHNKSKHGLAVRTRTDVRVSFTTAPLTVGDDVPLSTVVGPNAVSLIGGAAMDFLAKPPQSAGGHTRGRSQP